MPSKLMIDPKQRIEVLCRPNFDRSKAKNRGIMPSKLIGPPIIRWKGKKKETKTSLPTVPD